MYKDTILHYSNENTTTKWLKCNWMDHFVENCKLWNMKLSKILKKLCRKSFLFWNSRSSKLLIQKQITKFNQNQRKYYFYKEQMLREHSSPSPALARPWAWRALWGRCPGLFPAETATDWSPSRTCGWRRLRSAKNCNKEKKSLNWRKNTNTFLQKSITKIEILWSPK